jgi:LuxR family transcriptional regulator, maltose regulon positive regulatory protein
MTDMDHILLQTKLHQPLISRGLIDRPQLFGQLNATIDYPLTLICAPAGYGKTTLICSWLNRFRAGRSGEESSIPSAWLSLDEEESDFSFFLRYFIAAIRTIFPDACEETLTLLRASQQPPQAIFYITLCNDLDNLPGDAILVLDDYQFIRGKEVHDVLGEMVRHWPKPLHLVLISRIDPPLPLSSLRAKKKILEIRTQDLRFSQQETSAYLDQAQFFHLNEHTLDLVNERFEGWPAGLHLAALSLRSTGSQEAVQLALSSEDANITGYLLDEVLTRQFPAIHSFLLRTSILDRFCASLCEAVIGEIDNIWNVRSCLDLIEHSELFLSPLDSRREWFRYHHLFQELLQQRLSIEISPDQVNDLHHRASAWFEEHGLLDEALHHAQAAGDYSLAARQMSAGMREVINREDRLTLERWLRMLPEELIQQQPQLLMIKAWALQFSWRLDLQAQVLKHLEDLLDADEGVSLPADDLHLLRTQILLLKAQQAYLSNQPMLTIDLCNQVLEHLPASWTFGRGAAMLFLGFSMQASGQAKAAERLLLDAYGAYSDKADSYALLILDSLCFIYQNTGQLEQTRQSAQVLVQGAVQSGIAFMQNLGNWYLGLVCYQFNELETAAQYFTQIIENRYTVQVTTYRDSVAGLALIYQILGQSTEAWRVVESISQFDLEQTGSEELRTRSLRARLFLMQGDIEKAGRWVDTLIDPPPNQPLMWLEEPQVTRVRILVDRGQETDLRLATELLDTLEEIADRTFNTRYKIIILSLRAVTLYAQGKTSLAEAVLKQALDLGKAGGFIRVFVDLGKPMQSMLHQLVSQGYSVETINHILAAFPEEGRNRMSSESPVKPAEGSSPGIFPLVEPLTRRELEVLTLLRGPSSIKEIALKLNISYSTAKEYTINIYSKLGVNRRWDAVAKAEELNLLPPRRTTSTSQS